MSQGRPDQPGPRPAAALDQPAPPPAGALSEAVPRSAKALGQHGSAPAGGAVQAADRAAADSVGHSGPDLAADAAVPDNDAAGLDHLAARPASRLRAAFARPVTRHLVLLLLYLAAGVTLTWPRAAMITGLLPQSRDVASYVWDLWWVAHQIAHLGNPWFTAKMAAPAGIQLGYDTTMPLAGLIMTPVTLAFGPSASFTLLTIVAPGLACYAAFRAARLWLAGPGAVAAGALFGLASMFDWQAWYHLNIALGTIFLPLTLEAAVRLRRRPRARTALTLGLILGACVLVNQESAVLAAVLAAAVLGAWLIWPGSPAAAESAGRGRAGSSADPAAGPDDGREPARLSARAQLGLAALGVLATLIIASPQLIAMGQQAAAGGASAPAALLAHTGKEYAVGLPGLFAPTARVGDFGLHGLAHATEPTAGRTGEGMPLYGLLLTVLAVAGLAVSWRRRPAWWLALLWLGAAVLTLGPSLFIGKRQFVPLAEIWHRQRISGLMPYTWLMHIPGLSALREADRFALLGLLGAVILAGALVDWLTRHAWPVVIVIAALAVVETGWQGAPDHGFMPTTLPRVDRPIAADHSGSIVVDVPYGLRGGIPQFGSQFSAKALLIATADGHPRAISYTSWVPSRTLAVISRHPFLIQLNRSEHGIPIAPLANASRAQVTAAQLAAAREDAHHLDLGWALAWGGGPAKHPIAVKYLLATGFRFAYQADGVWVYRYVG
jgi:hypothetical protein